MRKCKSYFPSHAKALAGAFVFYCKNLIKMVEYPQTIVGEYMFIESSLWIAFLFVLYWFLSEVKSFILCSVKISRIRQKHKGAWQKLCEWREARRFVYFGSCSYSKELIVVLIETYQNLLELKAEKDGMYLAYLYELLHWFPPPYDPPCQRVNILMLFSRMAMLES